MFVWSICDLFGGMWENCVLMSLLDSVPYSRTLIFFFKTKYHLCFGVLVSFVSVLTVLFCLFMQDKRY